MNEAQKKAYEWAKNQNYTSVAARYAKTLAELIDEKSNQELSLENLRQMDGEPVWIEVLDRPDLSRWHFIVRTKSLGLIAKDGLGQYECYPYNENRLTFCGCYFDIEHGHNYGINWLAYRHKLAR